MTFMQRPGKIQCYFEISSLACSFVSCIQPDQKRFSVWGCRICERTPFMVYKHTPGTTMLIIFLWQSKNVS